MSKISTVSGIIRNIRENETWVDQVKFELGELEDPKTTEQVNRVVTKKVTQINRLKVRLAIVQKSY